MAARALGGGIGRFASLVRGAASAQAAARVRAPLPVGARGIVDSESVGTVMRVDKEHWSRFMFGLERQLLLHVVTTAEEGNVSSVLSAMDSFWAQSFSSAGTDSWSIRGDVIDRVVQEKAPMRCCEIGTYCGYSALRIAQSLPENGILVSVEVDPLFAAIATKVVEHAGLDAKVKVLMGTVESKVKRISECLASGGSGDGPADFVLCDHSKELFVPDLRLLEAHGLVGPGTTVMGDTTVYPGEAIQSEGQNLLSYFAAHPQYRVQEHISTKEFNGITVSEWVHLP